VDIEYSWPTAIELEIDSTNGWGYWKVTINGCAVVEHESGDSGVWWLDVGSDVGNPQSIVLTVPAACEWLPTHYHLLYAGMECAIGADVSQGEDPVGGGYISFAACTAAACDSDGFNCRKWIEYGTFGQGRY
jgi:hypothetical protein